MLALPLSLAIFSCKKNSNTSSSYGIVSFTFNGQHINVRTVVDTTSGMGIDIVGRGPVPGTKDSAWLDLNLYDININWYAQLPTGSYYDTGMQAGSGLIYTDTAGSITYYDANVSSHQFYVNVTENKNGVLAGTFQGVMWLETPTGLDSSMVTDGRFSVQF